MPVARPEACQHSKLGSHPGQRVPSSARSSGAAPARAVVVAQVDARPGHCRHARRQHQKLQGIQCGDARVSRMPPRPHLQSPVHRGCHATERSKVLSIAGAPSVLSVCGGHHMQVRTCSTMLAQAKAMIWLCVDGMPAASSADLLVSVAVFCKVDHGVLVNRHSQLSQAYQDRHTGRAPHRSQQGARPSPAA